MKRLLQLLVLPLLCGGLASAADIHVFPGGSIQTAVSSAASGDRILIHAGTYSQVVSMSSKTNLTITSAGDGEVIIQGNGADTNTFWIENSSSITISNLTIKNTKKVVWVTGITVIGSGSNIQILGNKLTDISYRSGTFDPADNPNNNGAQYQGVNAISVVGSDAATSYSNIVIKDNEVSYCMTGWNEAIAVKGNIDGFNVENNKVHHITNIGIDAFGLGSYPAIATNNQARNGSIKKNEVYNCICNYTDNGAIYIDGGLTITVMNNKVYNNIYGITIGCENQMNKPDGATEFIEVRNNLVYNNSRAGIMVGTGGDDDGQQGITRNIKVTGNTFLKNATADQWAGEFLLQNAHNIEFYNNIFQGQWFRLGTVNNGAVTNTFGYNLFFAGAGVTIDFSKQTGTSTWVSQTLAQFQADMSDASSTAQDPKLVNANVASIDAHLQSTSPAINNGKPGFVTITGEVDLDLQPRINGTNVDIGVDESGTVTTVAVTGVSVSPTSASIAVAATQQLTATIAPANATNQNKTWTTSNPAVATVNSSGLVTAVATGTAIITVTTQDGSKTATSSITVTSATVAVTGVSVSPTSASVAAGATQQLTATIAPANATNQNKTWSSDNSAIATVNASGLVTAVAAGTATITVTTQDGSKTATSSITVTTGSLPSPWITANIGSVAATGSATYSGGMFSVTGSGADIYGDADAFRYVYQSLNGDGEIKARVASLTNTNDWAKAGVMIRENLTANSNHALVAVTPASGVIFQRHIASGNTTNQAQVTGITAPKWVRVVRSGTTLTGYYSSDGSSWTQISTETISMATSVYVGLAVTSHSDGVLCTGALDNVTVTSGTIAVTSVNVNPTAASIQVNATQQLTATIAPANATNQNKTWSSSNTSIATVSSSGLVTAVATGSTTITVTTQDGSKTATSAITVTAATVGVTSVSVSPTSASIVAAGTQQLTATIAPSNATNQNKTWSSSNTAVATVNSTGLVTGVAAGSATITVTTQDGSKTATSAITVTVAGVAVTSVSVSPTSVSIAVAATQQLTASVAPSNATNQNKTWSSSNTSVATVNTAGLVTGVAPGSATITVTTQDGSKTATSSITVTSGTTTITIDGSLSDWSGVPAIATATGQTALSMKVYEDATYLYFGISGSGLGPHYQILINSDNNAATGYQHWLFASSGAEYYIQDGVLAPYSTYTQVGTATYMASSTVTEVKIAKSSFASLNTTITVGYVDINSGWSAVSVLGFASHTYGSPGGRVAGEENADAGEIDFTSSVFPNPSNGNPVKLKLYIPQQTAVRIGITDIAGREVFSKDLGTLEEGTYYQKIETLNFAAGIYLIKATVGSHTKIFKLIHN